MDTIGVVEDLNEEEKVLDTIEVVDDSTEEDKIVLEILEIYKHPKEKQNSPSCNKPLQPTDENYFSIDISFLTDYLQNLYEEIHASDMAKVTEDTEEQEAINDPFEAEKEINFDSIEVFGPEGYQKISKIPTISLPVNQQTPPMTRDPLNPYKEESPIENGKKSLVGLSSFNANIFDSCEKKSPFKTPRIEVKENEPTFEDIQNEDVLAVLDTNPVLNPNPTQETEEPEQELSDSEIQANVLKEKTMSKIEQKLHEIQQQQKKQTIVEIIPATSRSEKKKLRKKEKRIKKKDSL